MGRIKARTQTTELHHDIVAEEALGGHSRDLGMRYFTSAGFIGTVVVSLNLTDRDAVSHPALINVSIGPSPNITWVAISWTLGLAVGFTLVGRLSDIFGRRWFFIGASVLGLVGNIIGASAQSINMLIATNCINGLAAAGQLSFHITLGELVPNALRGPTMLHVGGKSKMKQLQTLDWIGITLFTSGMTIFLIGMNWGGGTYPWRSGHVLGALFAGFGTLVGFCVYEAYAGHQDPLIPMRLFRSIRYNANVVCASLGGVVYYANSIVWPSMIGSLFTSDVSKTGWLSCAVGGGLLLGQILGGAGVRCLPRMKFQMIVAGVVATTFTAAVAASDASTETRTTAFILIGTIGAGYVENLTLSSTAYLWDPADMGLVTGVLGAIRTAVSAIATSMYSSILATEASKYLPQKVTPSAVIAGLPSSSLPALLEGVRTGNLTSVPGMSPEILTAVNAAVKDA
ncbi:hypothetical protein E8E12_008141 [Didymella heteroderae]|uniref:Uncharacterized protein n=1 Tax=Didymella heteroderae TaxID=1769908 RepID=A0A9P5BZC2_9PLEO|nr:hypothetical protein E8E12_008141 [Didymella heteroderae]